MEQIINIGNDSIKVAEIEVTYRSKIKPSERQTITTSSDAVDIFRKNWEQGKIEHVEQFKILFLNRGNKVLCIYNLSSGGVSGTVADPKVIFAAALKVNAVNLILCHNHPSGCLKPSKDDVAITKKICAAAALLALALNLSIKRSCCRI